MIEALKSDEIVNKVGGRFKLTALIQKRMLELMDGARPLVERNGLTDLETVVQEILPVRPFRGGTILELGNNPEHFDWFKIVRVVSDWTRNAWTLPDIEGLRLDGPP